MSPKNSLTRQELYDLVWAEPMRSLAAKYGVSDVWLKKVFAKAEIPSPDRGYWAKLNAGKPVVRAKLQPRAPGTPDILTIRVPDHQWRYDPVAELAEPIPDLPVFTEPIDEVRDRVAKRIGKAARCKDLAAPCPAVRKLLQADDKRREKFVQQGYSWNEPIFDSPFEVRRLRLINALGLALPRVGGRIDCGCKSGRKLTVTVGAETMELLLDHPSAKPTQWGEWSTRKGPADTLKLELKSRYPDVLPAQAWVDVAGHKLEEHLTEIALAIAVAGEAQYRQREVSHHSWMLKRRAENEAEVIRRRIEAERKEREQRLKEQAERRERLFGQAQDWRVACDIRGFVNEVLARRSRADDGLAAWAGWARAEADALDPVLNGSLTPADIAMAPEGER